MAVFVEMSHKVQQAKTSMLYLSTYLKKQDKPKFYKLMAVHTHETSVKHLVKLKVDIKIKCQGMCHIMQN
jgi:hypothetical protein